MGTSPSVWTEGQSGVPEDLTTHSSELDLLGDTSPRFGVQTVSGRHPSFCMKSHRD